MTPKYNHTHLVQNVSVMTHSRSTFVLKCLTYTIFRAYVYSPVSV